MKMLFELAEKANLREKIQGMVTGKKINITEDRAVLHTVITPRRVQQSFQA